MNPILYESSETTFTTNGLGVLAECAKCTVTEKRNGVFDAEFQYPINGVRYADIQEGRIICVSHDNSGDVQPFVIYGRSAPISGMVTFNCHHISYLLNGVTVNPFTATSVAEAFSAIASNSLGANPFTFQTDNTTAGTMKLQVPVGARSVLGGMEGSVLDVYGGEYKYDKFTVYNLQSRGVDSGVTIRYGKDMTDMTQKIDADGLYNSVVPYWAANDIVVNYGAVVTATGQTAGNVVPLDLSNAFDSEPTTAQLYNRAVAYLDENKPWIPKVNLKVNFVPLWQTEEYKNFLPLTRVNLCDAVTVSYPELGVNATAKVISVVWDALAEKYTQIEIGDMRETFVNGTTQTATGAFVSRDIDTPITSFYSNRCENVTDGEDTHVYTYGNAHVVSVAVKMLVTPSSSQTSIISLPSGIPRPTSNVFGTIYNRTKAKTFVMQVSTAGNVNVLNRGEIASGDYLYGQIAWTS